MKENKRMELCRRKGTQLSCQVDASSYALLNALTGGRLRVLKELISLSRLHTCRLKSFSENFAQTVRFVSSSFLEWPQVLKPGILPTLARAHQELYCFLRKQHVTFVVSCAQESKHLSTLALLLPLQKGA